MANSPNFRPVQGVSSGEATQQLLVIEGSILWRPSGSTDYVRLTLVDDGTDSGTYVFRVDPQTSDNEVPA